MANLMTCQGLTKAFGAQLLFTDIALTIGSGDKIGLIGPNGSGKSTLLKILCGSEECDQGSIVLQKHICLSSLAQVDTFQETLSCQENLLLALEGSALEETERFHRVQTLLSRAEFTNDNSPVSALSGGWRKRLAICRALLPEPDILIMDEPTNHLDLEGILWLERLLNTGTIASLQAWLLVSHDRRFLENCTNRIIELSAKYPNGSFQVAGNYSRFLKERDHFLHCQEENETRLSNKVRRETEWLRRSPKARTGKARYRIDEAHRLREELTEVRDRNRAQKTIQIDFDTTGRKTKKLLEAVGIAKSYGEKPLFAGLDILLSPGTRLGILGRNGCGKSTLMQILAAADQAGGPKPDEGRITVADNIQIVSFDQKREKINPALTLKQALAPEGDSVVYQGRSLHIVSWAKKFQFSPEQLETPVAQLSGGEQARILLADIMRSPADILLLDEPSNDLDIASLDILEEGLLDFPGALVLVCHDRFLLDRICDKVLGFNGNGETAWYADYRQWLNACPSNNTNAKAKKKSETLPNKSPRKKKTARLTYMEQREYETIEERIAASEEKVATLQEKLNQPEIAADITQLAECWEQLETAKNTVDTLYARWDELEQKKNAQ